MTDKKLPYVQIATVCERVLQEPDGVITAVRLIDTITLKSVQLADSGNPTGPPLVQVLDFWLVVGLKTDGLRGSFTLSLRMVDPLGTVVPLGEEHPVLLTDTYSGVNYKLRFGLPQNAPEGRYWFDVMWEREVLTRFSLLLIREEGPVMASTTPQ